VQVQLKEHFLLALGQAASTSASGAKSAHRDVSLSAAIARSYLPRGRVRIYRI
jgi:hypothetical protein